MQRVAQRLHVNTVRLINNQLEKKKKKKRTKKKC